MSYARARVLAATALLAGAGIVSNGRHYLADRRLVAARGSRPDPVTEDAERYESLASWLPPQGTIGYLQPSDWPSPEAQRRFYLAEYALTPRLVVMSTAPEFVIAIPDASQPDGPAADHDPRLPDHLLYRRAANGLRIFRRIR